MPPFKTVGRLSLYRRLLREHGTGGNEYIYSHELAALARTTAAQVRRDVMNLGVLGNPAKGYRVDDLLQALGELLNGSEPQRFGLAGAGNLGRALLAFFANRGPDFSIAAAFDVDPGKVGRVVHGCRCYSLAEMEEVVARESITMGIVAVPAGVAQNVAKMFCDSGVRGLVNFAPVRLWVSEGVYVENVDLTMSMERAAFFARAGVDGKETVKS